jgi:hypothetical protein
MYDFDATTLSGLTAGNVTLHWRLMVFSGNANAVPILTALNTTPLAIPKSRDRRESASPILVDLSRHRGESVA